MAWYPSAPYTLLCICMPITPLSVFLAALLTALATGLGALPLIWFKRMPRVGIGLSNAMAAGLMLAASLMLLYEGYVVDLTGVLLGAALGFGFVALTQRWIDRYESPHVGMLRGLDARKALLVIGIMTIHSFTEGIGVGVSYGGGEQLGVFITTAIAFHNIPEGLAISLVLVPRGLSVMRAAGWSIFTSLPQPLMAVPAFLFVEAFAILLPYGLGFAAGAMLWMVAFELLPEARDDAPTPSVVAVLTLSIIGMLAFQVFLKG